jgi:hypothetical protein
MRKSRVHAACFLLITLIGVRHTFAADPAIPATQPVAAAEADQAALEQQFIQTMNHAELVGRFTMEGDKNPPREEHYTIIGVTKVHGDLWLINARIQFGSKDVTVPLILPVKWAGDTPMISVTDMGIPGIGKYTARVLIYDDHYAGTWFGSATHRGALFGKIDHPAATQPAEK